MTFLLIFLSYFFLFSASLQYRSDACPGILYARPGKLSLANYSALLVWKYSSRFSELLPKTACSKYADYIFGTYACYEREQCLRESPERNGMDIYASFESVEDKYLAMKFR